MRSGEVGCTFSFQSTLQVGFQDCHVSLWLLWQLPRFYGLGLRVLGICKVLV